MNKRGNEKMAIDNQTVNSESRQRWIEMVQRQLIRENPSALPTYGVDGSYGPETTDWVERFQNRKGIPVDGIAGPETLQRFRDDIVQRPDTSGRGVEILQETLLFFYIQQSSVDGIYGPGTTQAVRDFQFLNNMVVDGVAGPNTLKLMDEQITTILVEEGETGTLVRRIQNQLNDQGEVEVSIEVDGNFGSATKEAVESFQQAIDQYEDGIVEPFTMNRLDLEASHPLTSIENSQMLEDGNYSIETNPVSNIDEFVEILEASTVFQNNKPSGSNERLSGVEVVEVSDSRDDDEMDFFRLEGSLDESSGYVYVFAMFDEDKNLLSFIFIIRDGSNYNDLAQLIHYDRDGVILEETEEATVELINEQLLSQLKISDAVTTGRQGQLRVQDLPDFCDILLVAGAGAACSALAGAATFGTGAAIMGTACSAGVASVTETGRCS